MSVLFMLVVFIGVSIAVNAASPARVHARLVKRGIPGRGILLRVSPQPVRTVGTPGRRFELRRVQIDVELPGEPPYVVDTAPYIPTNLVRDVLPGSTVELRVSRSNRDRLAIVGPGVGFAGAAQLMAAPVAASANGGSR